MERKPLNKLRSFLGFSIPGLLLLLLVFPSCNKDGGVCVSNTGKIILQERQVGDFDSISMNDNVNLILTQDSVNKVVVEAGEKIIQGITTDVKNHLLIIGNQNSCNWLRSYNNPINVHVSVKNLWKVIYQSSGDLTSTNAISSDIFMVDAWGGCGTIDIQLNIQEGFFLQHMGTANFILRGLCKINSIYAGDFGSFQCKDLNTGYTFIKNYGLNECWVNATRYLDATIGSVGNIYYRGEPDTVMTHIHGSGQVIPF